MSENDDSSTSLLDMSLEGSTSNSESTFRSACEDFDANDSDNTKSPNLASVDYIKNLSTHSDETIHANEEGDNNTTITEFSPKKEHKMHDYLAHVASDSCFNNRPSVKDDRKPSSPLPTPVESSLHLDAGGDIFQEMFDFSVPNGFSHNHEVSSLFKEAVPTATFSSLDILPPPGVQSQPLFDAVSDIVNPVHDTTVSSVFQPDGDCSSLPVSIISASDFLSPAVESHPPLSVPIGSSSDLPSPTYTSHPKFSSANGVEAEVRLCDLSTNNGRSSLLTEEIPPAQITALPIFSSPVAKPQPVLVSTASPFSYIHANNSASPAHLIGTTDQIDRDTVDGNTSSMFFPDEQPSDLEEEPIVKVDLKVSLELPAKSPETVEASSSIVFVNFFIERYSLEMKAAATIQSENLPESSLRKLSLGVPHSSVTVTASAEAQITGSSHSFTSPYNDEILQQLGQLPHAPDGSVEAQVAHKLALIGDEINRQYGQRFDQIIDEVPLSQDPMKLFGNVARILFSRGPTNWGQIVSLFYFGYRLALRRLVQGIVNAVSQVINCLVKFCHKFNIFSWIAARGGWVIFEYLCPTTSTDEMDSGSSTIAPVRNLATDLLALPLNMTADQLNTSLVVVGCLLVLAGAIAYWRR